ncbi:phage tail protein [Bacillus amyloliquefaciens]|uniref:phage tail protein n=1 Tax=Bacillus amyloliquefaciens TaxID=1390 RepID=UPI0005EEC849|nr:hypothetical protein [Bacillus amyloliquefaciens]
MANLADILVSLTLDTEEFNRGLQQVSRQLQDLGSSTNTVIQQTANIVSSGTAEMSAGLNRVGTSSRYLSRTLGTSADDMQRVLQAAQSEFNNFSMAGRRVSQQIRDEFSALPSHLQRYVQRLQEAGQSTEAFAALNQQMSQRIIGSLRESNDYLQQRTTQSARLMQSISDNTNLAPLTNGFLRLGNNLEQTARQGTALNLALQRIGPNASLKDLQDQMKLITQGVARARGAFLVFGISAGLATYGMIKLAAAVDDRVAPAFENMKKNLVSAMEPFIHAFATAMVNVMNFVSSIAQMVAQFSHANPLLFNMIMAIGMLTLAFGALLAPLAVTGVMAEGVAASFAALWAMIAPFVLGFLAVIGVATALATVFVVLWVSIQQLWQNSQAFQSAFIALWNGIKTAIVDNVVTPIQTAWNNLKLAFSNLIATVTGGSGTMGSLWSWLGGIFATVVSAITATVLPIFQAAMQILGQVVTAVINGIIVVVNWMAQMWQQHGATITAVVTQIWTWIQQAFSAIASFIMSIMPQIIGIATDGWDLIKTVIDVVMKYIAPVVVAAFKTIWSIIKFIMPTVLSIIKGTWDNIKSVITSTINIIRNVIQLFTNILKGNWKGAWENVKAILKNAVVLIWNLIQLYFLGKLLKPFTGFISKGKSILSAGWKGFMSIIKGVMNGIKAFVVGVWNAITSALRGSFTGIANLAKTVFNGMKRTITTVFNGVKSAASRVFNAVKTLITHPIESAKRTVLGIIKGIVKAFAAMHISIPKIKLPHISVGSKEFLGGKVKIPTFKISWNAKGNIFNGASILGGGQGVGEAGAEAVMPIQHKRYMKPFAGAVASQLNKMGDNSNQVAGGNQYQIQFNEPVVIREDADIQRIVDELERRRKISERAKGVFSY